MTSVVRRVMGPPLKASEQGLVVYESQTRPASIHGLSQSFPSEGVGIEGIVQDQPRH